ncbi:hypothetical protein J27TS7_15220 [Paenibacillus dendritiformis]|nr:hypothetical protein J27TS7_15220 [Paenibacillus dendritiformis]
MAPSPPPQALNRKGSVSITARLPCRQPLVRLMSDTTSFKFVAGDGEVSPRLSYVYEQAVRFMTSCWAGFGWRRFSWQEGRLWVSGVEYISVVANPHAMEMNKKEVLNDESTDRYEHARRGEKAL